MVDLRVAELVFCGPREKLSGARLNTKAIGPSTVSKACIATVEDTVSKIDQYQPIDTSESFTNQELPVACYQSAILGVLEEIRSRKYLI
jgi:hypothetical protein